MHATALELAILKWIGRNTPTLLGLEEADILRREYTGAGFFVYLGPDAKGSWDQPPIDGHVIDGPVIDAPGLPYGGGSVLWLSQGKPNCLEIFCNGDGPFPEHLDEFELSGWDDTV